MDAAASDCGLLGNGVVGVLAETINIWERRAPLAPSHCARLLLNGKANSGVRRIVVQPSTRRIHHDAQYEDAGCEISDDLSECGLIVGIKQPKLETILPDRAYAFFSHTHKAQTENMPLLDKILAERITLYDYELIVGEDSKRLLAFGKFAGRAGLIDFLHGLGRRYLNLGYSTPFLSLGASYMYSSLAAAKAAVISVGEEIATFGLPDAISPIVFIFTGDGNVSQGAQEIFKLLPHSFVDVHELPEIIKQAKDLTQQSQTRRKNIQVYGCIVTCKDMVAPKDPARSFHKEDYYAHPDHYNPVFHERIAPYASVIVNCMYWEKRFPRLLSTQQLQELMKKGCPLMGICDITCDIGGSLEFVKQATSIERPFLRYDPFTDSYHDDMIGDGPILLSIDTLPTEFSREASQHFGDILSQFIGNLASAKHIEDLPFHLIKACITHVGQLTSLYEYIPRMRKTSIDPSLNSLNILPVEKKCCTMVSLTGHLFDQFLINDALDVIESAGGSFRLVRCDVGQNTDSTSYSELEVGAKDTDTLDRILDALTSIANPSYGHSNRQMSLKIHQVNGALAEDKDKFKKRSAVLVLGAGRVCRPAVEFLASIRNISHYKSCEECESTNGDELEEVEVIVASLYQRDAEETIQGIQNARAVQLDATDYVSVSEYVSQVEVVVSLLPASFHAAIANACIEHKKHMVTASYVDDSMSRLNDKAQSAGITILCEMGLDPGIDHMMAMKMIDQAHNRKGKVKSFTSYCGGLPSPAAANNPLAYKFSWNPAGAIKAGRNPATYKFLGEIRHVDGNKLYDSATRFRIPDLPAFALEYLPNRDSLVYGNLYGITDEASTIFRATLRYEGFSEIMATFARIGFFQNEPHAMLTKKERPTYAAFLNELLADKRVSIVDAPKLNLEDEQEIVQRLIELAYCKELATAVKTVKTIKFLGLHEHDEIPAACLSSFDVVCLRMEKRLTYSSDEQDMVLLHHELEVEYDDGRTLEKHRATLLEFGRDESGKVNSAMALTVGIPAAIGALLLLQKRIHKKGVLRPLESEIYEPALEILEGSGIKLMEQTEAS